MPANKRPRVGLSMELVAQLDANIDSSKYEDDEFEMDQTSTY